MDKKILLGGAAALIMAGSMVATPASANISLELSGEAQVCQDIIISTHQA